MLYFSSDYMEGCHPNILRRLSEINMDKNPGYGTDAICESAKNKIRLRQTRRGGIFPRWRDSDERSSDKVYAALL